MLLDMKSRVEEHPRAHHQARAAQTTGSKCSAARNEQKLAYHQGQVDLLVPLVKAYATDQGFRVCETAIQTYGGVGYIEGDFLVEQYCRDARSSASTRAPTLHPGDPDLVGRKLGQAGGANLQAFLGDVAQFVQKHGRGSGARSRA